MSAALRDAFERQAEACENLGSPFMGRLMGLCADRLAAGTDISDRLLGWPGGNTKILGRVDFHGRWLTLA
jgi:hypothetical protein